MSAPTTCLALLRFSHKKETCPVKIEEKQNLCMFHQGCNSHTAQVATPYKDKPDGVISDDDLVKPLAELLLKHKDVVLRKMATFLSLLQTETPEEEKKE